MQRLRTHAAYARWHIVVGEVAVTGNNQCSVTAILRVYECNQISLFEYLQVIESDHDWKLFGHVLNQRIVDAI